MIIYTKGRRLGQKDISSAAIILGFALLVLSVSSFIVGVQKREESFASEVPMTQVTVVGTKFFEAKIRINYKDGRLDKVSLIPKTTVEVGGNMPAEKK